MFSFCRVSGLPWAVCGRAWAVCGLLFVGCLCVGCLWSPTCISLELLCMHAPKVKRCVRLIQASITLVFPVADSQDTHSLWHAACLGPQLHEAPGGCVCTHARCACACLGALVCQAKALPLLLLKQRLTPFPVLLSSSLFPCLLLLRCLVPVACPCLCLRR